MNLCAIFRIVFRMRGSSGATGNMNPWSFVSSTPQIGLNLPLDVRGTAFQRRVWRPLQDIPTGQTRSYSEIARSVDAPKAVRAGASACAANNIAVAIPCHRVVRSDGALSGYAWGVERKRELIAREANQA
jgi:AraC family transcriptional regulator, regulatory protein of adaptative response / methylated-DNA-[protein]-cysteine methyltransferase